MKDQLRRVSKQNKYHRNTARQRRSHENNLMTPKNFCISARCFRNHHTVHLTAEWPLTVGFHTVRSGWTVALGSLGI